MTEEIQDLIVKLFSQRGDLKDNPTWNMVDDFLMDCGTLSHHKDLIIRGADKNSIKTKLLLEERTRELMQEGSSATGADKEARGELAHERSEAADIEADAKYIDNRYRAFMIDYYSARATMEREDQFNGSTAKAGAKWDQ